MLALSGGSSLGVARRPAEASQIATSQEFEELQGDVDIWLKQYNETRPHSGKYCFRKTPMQTFLDAKHLFDEKQLDRIPVQTPSGGLSPRAARAVVA